MKCNKCNGETVGDQLQCDGCFMEDHSYPVAPGLCPDPIPDDIQEELATLRERVRELEATFTQIVNLTCVHHTDAERSKITCPVCLASRIRELEEAMPDDRMLRGIVTGLYLPPKYEGIRDELLSAADRIEKVMKK